MKNLSRLLKSARWILPGCLTLTILLFTVCSPAQELSYADKTDEIQARFSAVADEGRSIDNGQVYIRSYTENTGNGLLRKNFRIKVTEDGSYHLAVHVLATRQVPVDNTVSDRLYPLQEITVYVDGADMGVLSLQQEGWHSTGLKSGKELALSAGEHLISFECAAPYYPEIDVVKFASNKENAKLDTSHYTKYIDQLLANMERNRGKTEKMEFEEPSASENDSQARLASASNGTTSWEVTPYPLGSPLKSYKNMMTVPVVYTYYRKISLTSGQNITFHTTPIAGQDYYSVDPVMYLFCDANHNHAWSNDDHTGRHPRIQITVPQTGDYYLVLRAFSSYYASTPTGSQGVVDVWQNGSSLNTNVPVSGFLLDVSSSESGTLNYFTAYSTGIPKLWLARDGVTSPIRFHGSTFWYVPPMTFNWFDDARFRVVKSGSGNLDMRLLVSSEGAWWVYWGNADAYGSVKEASGDVLGGFPSLYASDGMQTAPGTNNYNCGSWAGGFVNGWFWGCLSPTNTSSCTGMYYGSAYAWSTWDDFFGNNPPRYSGSKEYTRTSANSSNGEIAVWAISGTISTATHFSIRREANNHAHGYDWESKPGGKERIFHPRDALNGAVYGSIIEYYRDANRDPYNPWNARIAANSSKKTFYSLQESIDLGLSIMPQVDFDASEKAQIKNLVEENGQHVSLAERTFADWLKACQSEELQLYSDPAHFFQLNEFYELEKQYEKQPEAVMSFLFGKIRDKEDEDFELHLSGMLLAQFLHHKYGHLLELVKEEWAQNNYTKDGAYIVPSVVSNTKNYIKKILNVESGRNGTGFMKTSDDNHEKFRIYPNPVLEKSEASFSLKKASQVTVKIIASNGTIVKVLEAGRYLEPGTYSYTIHAKDFKPGVYICTMNTGVEVYSRKILVP